MRSHRMSGHRAEHDRLHIYYLITRKKSATSQPWPLSFLQSVPIRAIRSRLHWSSLNPRDTVRTSMPHWKLILTYDGTSFNGWQIQPNLPTIQGTLAPAIHRVTGESVLPQGSGRTDAGVHALGQVASFSLTVPI